MPLKREIVAELGATELLLSDGIASALAANDEVKYYFALLQTARSNADRPRVPVPDLKGERIACQIRDAFLDDVVAGTKKNDDGSYAIPHTAELLRRIKTSIGTMLSCLPEDERGGFDKRLGQLVWPPIVNDAISGAQIDAMTSGNRAAGDGFHLVVMDAHRAINRLQAATAPENIAGAHAHGLSAASRPLVVAFMAGLNRTSPLKFDHPGLGTTATEHAGRLLIQNDIGTTDAHVLVIRVDGLAAAVTYTDVHLKRQKFFKSLLESFDVTWEDAEPKSSDKFEAGTYFLTTGTFRAADASDLARYLTYLGSRIVFLIDWNHMRKRLDGFVSKQKAVEVLKWAAEHDFGHRGLLEIGGEHALAAAVEYAAGERLHYGDRLNELIGEDHASAFLCEAMQVSSTGLLAGRSRRMIQDEIKARLRRYFDESGLMIFDIAARHAACGYDLAAGVREAIERIAGNGGDSDWIARLKVRAVAWEARADQLLNDARDDVKRFKRPLSLIDFLGYGDDAVDEMEEAASLIDLFALVASENPPLKRLLLSLADTALGSAQEFVKSIECAATITRADMRDDLDDFLGALERLVALEHRADDEIRALRHQLVVDVKDARAIYVVHQLSAALETATDAYLHAGQALRGYLMEEVIV